MGKYPNSDLHAWYSDWHYKHCHKDAWLTDIDRLWIEMGRTDPIAYTDIKRHDDDITYQELLLMDWFEARGVPAYVVYVSAMVEAPKFWVMRWETKKYLTMSATEYTRWINARRFGIG